MKKFKFILIALIFIFNIAVNTSCGAKNPIVEQEKFNVGSTTRPGGNVQQLPAPSPTGDPNLVTDESVPIGSYETTLLDKDPDRINNIELAAGEISVNKIQAGEVFSFNEVVGKRKPEDGYEKAKIIVNGKRKEGFGGGICQLSSTLFNAVVKSGMEIVERHSHSKDVHYVPMGKDAAISYGTMDFKFRNTKNYPVKIEAGVANGKVYVTIFKA